jgi:hypothetical protein
MNFDLVCCSPGSQESRKHRVKRCGFSAVSAGCAEGRVARCHSSVRRVATACVVATACDALQQSATRCNAVRRAATCRAFHRAATSQRAEFRSATVSHWYGGPAITSDQVGLHVNAATKAGELSPSSVRTRAPDPKGPQRGRLHPVAPRRMPRPVETRGCAFMSLRDALRFRVLGVRHKTGSADKRPLAIRACHGGTHRVPCCGLLHLRSLTAAGWELGAITQRPSVAAQPDIPIRLGASPLAGARLDQNARPTESRLAIPRCVFFAESTAPSADGACPSVMAGHWSLSAAKLKEILRVVEQSRGRVAPIRRGPPAWHMN